jgi:hypothetical protein
MDRGILVLLAVFLGAAPAGADVVRTLSCEFKDVFTEFQVEVDMTSKRDFAARGQYISGEKETLYPVTQQAPETGELHRFVMTEMKPRNRLEVRVLKAREEKRDAQRAVARFLDLDAPLNEIEGFCVYY